MNQFEVMAAAQIIEAARAGKRVARLLPDGYIVRGVARSVGREDFNFDYTTDVRKLYLRVSGTVEHAWPMTELMDELATTTFVIEED